VLEAEKVDRTPVAGLSAGAMYAWASAETLGDRVTAVVAISPAINIEPYADVRAALSKQFNLMTFLARHAPGVLAAMQRRQSRSFEGPKGQAKFVKAMRKISPDDATLIEDDAMFREFRTISSEGRRQGNLGGEEFALVSRPWGFDPAAQQVPCTVVYGSTDPLTPAIRAWLTHAPNAVGREVPGGHLQTAMATGRAAVIAALLG
jgi:pimeloyl-ACP methyl ester carboxylesterase